MINELKPVTDVQLEACENDVSAVADVDSTVEDMLDIILCDWPEMHEPDDKQALINRIISQIKHVTRILSRVEDQL